MLLYKRTVLLGISLLIVNSTCDFQKCSLGDPCTISSNNMTGVCVLLEDCPKAIENNQSNIMPQICTHLEGQRTVVCCERKVPKTVPGDISKQKCMEYSVKYSIISMSPIIVGGEKVPSVEEFPHMALLGFGDPQEPRWGCGGALISEHYILTAAHCTETREGLKPTVALLGFLNINRRNESDSLQQFGIADIKIHPDYRPPQPYADIALLKLNESAKFTLSVFPACLHQEKNILDKFATAAGWGVLKYGTRTMSDDLMKVRISLRSFAECSELYPPERRKLPRGIVDDIQFCAGDPNRDTCQGDSGGPLQIYHSELIQMHDIIGVTSFGSLCGIKPGVFVRVSQFVPWIESIVWP